MAEQKNSGLFREKSLEAIESPESLNDYLRVTSPGVWIVLAAIIALLVGLILWSVFGRIETVATLAVTSRDDEVLCYIPYEDLQEVMRGGVVTVNGEDLPLEDRGNSSVVIISEDTDAYLRVTGNLEVGDVTVTVPVNASLPNGIYAGTAVTESLQPITLLLQ